MDLLLINKPLHWTSNDVVRKVKKILKCQKIGHAGTLDPLASGLLILGINEKTKCLSAISNDQKTYECIIQFGYETKSYDLETEVCATTNHQPTLCSIIDTLDFWQWKGYEQTPPAYSALKIHGKPSYLRARNGEDVTLTPRHVEIYDYEILKFQNNELWLRITVSKGFYVRSLAHDLGVATKSLGTLAMLKRTSIGKYNLSDAMEIKDLYDYRTQQ